ncbi:hypothetical protein BBJ28_00018455 [Nothophytophthora sp. Chile5]|nr:hypothetical protein BBJ28_00018455 [Nothophytophthora sp. Chile5]
MKPPRRFCWRERTEKVNWRMLKALDLVDVVRRGDPALLEPYALHVTFARLPAAATARDPGDRDAWFVVRVLQLAMEYLLFMRARDGDVLDSLGQELQQCERASPSAVATIETLLTELMSERRARQRKRAAMEKEKEFGNDGEEVLRPSVQEARVCGFCGKLFSSPEYLEKHLVRRHAGASRELKFPPSSKRHEPLRDEEAIVSKRKQDDEPEQVMQKMVRQVERALQEHEENLRSLAKEEARKVQQVYEQLHVETQLAEELKASRLKSEKQHEHAQRQLDEILQQKQEAEDALADLKEQIQFLTLKKKMMGPPALNAVLPASFLVHEASVEAEREVKRLQQTLEMVNSELATSREELAKLQAAHLTLLRNKQGVASALPVAEPQEVSPIVRHDNASQTDQIFVADHDTQTDEEPVNPSEKVPEPPPPSQADIGTDAPVLNHRDIGTQMVEALPAVVQVAVMDDLPPSVAEQLTGLGSTSGSPADAAVQSGSPQPTMQVTEERLPDYIQQIHIQELLDMVTARAQTAVRVASDVTVASDGSGSSARICCSLPRHKFVRSRFHHDEQVVNQRISSCLEQLEQFSRRFGVPAKSSWLSSDNLQLVQRALHGHLEVLPTDVLSKMVDCENAVNAMITKEWVPREKARQQALERFKVETQAKSQANQGLVRQAMAAFTSTGEAKQQSGVGLGKGAEVEDADRLGTAGIEKNESGSSREEGQDVSIEKPKLLGLGQGRRYSGSNVLTVTIEERAGGYGAAQGKTEDSRVPEEHSSAMRNNAAPAIPHQTTDAVDHPQTLLGQKASIERLQNDHLDDENGVEDVAVADSNGGVDAEDLPVRRDLPGAQIASVAVKSRLLYPEQTPSEIPLVSASSVAAANEFKDAENSSTDRLGEEQGDTTRRSSAVLLRTDSTGDEVAGQADVGFAVPTMTDESALKEPAIEELGTIPEQEPSVAATAGFRSPPLITTASPAASPTISGFEGAASALQSLDSLESDRLSAVSPFAEAGLGRWTDRSIPAVASSEMSFDASIPSLGTDSVGVNASASKVVTALDDLQADKDEESLGGESFPPVSESQEEGSMVPAESPRTRFFATPASFTNDSDSVMSFDESGIEEVLLT